MLLHTLMTETHADHSDATTRHTVQGEREGRPVRYYVAGSLELALAHADLMRRCGCHRVAIFAESFRNGLKVEPVLGWVNAGGQWLDEQAVKALIAESGEPAGRFAPGSLADLLAATV